MKRKRIECIAETVKLIIRNGEYPSYEKVVELSGVPKKYIRTHKEVKEAFEEIRKNLYVNVKRGASRKTTL
ncbi:hypothetical protein HMSSN036_48710 [Paenibacillus macerans]|nr:hypothetical protein HMSSN036_48710 [Paenibacillus macerans]